MQSSCRQWRWRNPDPLVHQVYDYDYRFCAFRWLQHHATLEECDGATSEGVTDIQLVNLVAAPFGPRLSLKPNRGCQASGYIKTLT